MSKLDALPEGWAIATLEEIADWGSGGTPTRSVTGYYNGKIPWVTIADLNNNIILETRNYITELGVQESAARVVPEKTILLALYGSIGKLGIAGKDLTTNQAIATAIPNSLWLDHKYLFHYLESQTQSLNQLGSGVTQKNIYLKNVKTYPIQLAPRKEQTRIVEKLEELLSDLDNGVAELKAAQTKLTQYRQSLLKSAVEGSLTAEWRKQNPVTETGEQLLQRILTERRQRWEQQKLAEFKEKGKTPPKDWQEKYPEPVQPDTSELPELPDGWVWASLGQCFRVEVGATPSRKQPSYWGGDIPWASSGEIQFGRVSDTKEKITEEGLNNSSTNINPKGSVLLGMIGEGKTRGQAAILDIDAANNQNCAAIWVPVTQISTEYVFYWLWSRYVETRRDSSGNNQPALNKSLVEKMPIPISSFEEMNLIGEKLASEFNSIRVNQLEIEKSMTFQEAQRKNILKEAFSGKLAPQNPNDEPASVLLEKIKAERAAQAKLPKPKRAKKKPNIMNNFDLDALKKWISEFDKENFTFADMEAGASADYENLKNLIFIALSESKPVIYQCFDDSDKKMVFKKASV